MLRANKGKEHRLKVEILKRRASVIRLSERIEVLDAQRRSLLRQCHVSEAGIRALLTLQSDKISETSATEAEADTTLDDAGDDLSKPQAPVDSAYRFGPKPLPEQAKAAIDSKAQTDPGFDADLGAAFAEFAPDVILGSDIVSGPSTFLQGIKETATESQSRLEHKDKATDTASPAVQTQILASKSEITIDHPIKVGMDGAKLAPRVREMIPVQETEFDEAEHGFDPNVKAFQPGAPTRVQGGQVAAVAAADVSATIAQQFKEEQESKAKARVVEGEEIAMGIDRATFDILQKDEKDLTHREKLMRRAFEEQMAKAEIGSRIIELTKARLKEGINPTTYAERAVRAMMDEEEESMKIANGDGPASVYGNESSLHETKLRQTLFAVAVHDALVSKGVDPTEYGLFV